MRLNEEIIIRQSCDVIRGKATDVVISEHPDGSPSAVMKLNKNMVEEARSRLERAGIPYQEAKTDEIMLAIQDIWNSNR